MPWWCWTTIGPSDLRPPQYNVASLIWSSNFLSSAAVLHCTFLLGLLLCLLANGPTLYHTAALSWLAGTWWSSYCYCYYISIYCYCYCACQLSNTVSHGCTELAGRYLMIQFCIMEAALLTPGYWPASMQTNVAKLLWWAGHLLAHCCTLFLPISGWNLQKKKITTTDIIKLGNKRQTSYCIGVLYLSLAHFNIDMLCWCSTCTEITDFVIQQRVQHFLDLLLYKNVSLVNRESVNAYPCSTVIFIDHRKLIGWSTNSRAYSEKWDPPIWGCSDMIHIDASITKSGWAGHLLIHILSYSLFTSSNWLYIKSLLKIIRWQM